MINKSTYHPETGKCTYSRPPHHGEMRFGTKITNEGTDESKQNLAAKYGIDRALKLLKKYHEQCRTT
jgi:hypothetical protein